MEKSSDSSSSSWVFVYGNVNSTENIKNAFHLDCSQEPIQELTEQDLSSSDIELDNSTDTSDGISIINESDVPFEDNCATYRDCLKVEDIHNTQFIENHIACVNPLCLQSAKVSGSWWDWKILFNALNIVSAGVVLSAVVVALYSSLKNTGIVPKESVLTFDSSGAKSKVEEIVAKTIACACGEKTRKDFETEVIKQCVFNHLNTNDKPIDYKVNNGIFNNDKKIKAGYANDNIIQGFNLNSKLKTRRKLKRKKFEKVISHMYNKKKLHNKNGKHRKHRKDKQEGSYLSGEWYSNMHKYRDYVRKKDSKKDRAEWYFKRANARRQYRD